MKRGNRWKHGLRRNKDGSTTRVYSAWFHMLQRCENKRNKDYRYYGGRGIRVCERWKSFENFLKDMGEPPDGHSLDRIENDGDYEPGNCRWATRRQQMRNTRGVRTFTMEGIALCLVEWAEKFGVNYDALRAKLDRGSSIEEAARFYGYAK